MKDYYCELCGAKICSSAEISGRKTILEVPGQSCECFLLKPEAEQGSLAALEHRVDDFLPEVWSCCRISAMRSLRDNKDGGIIAYTDGLVELEAGSAPPEPIHDVHPVRLTGETFAGALHSWAEDSERLRVVKFTALWCPPCRIMDRVFKSLIREGDLPQVDFYEVDADVEQDLADSYKCPSLPFIVFYKGERRLDPSRITLAAINGGLGGAFSRTEFKEICEKLLKL